MYELDMSDDAINELITASVEFFAEYGVEAKRGDDGRWTATIDQDYFSEGFFVVGTGDGFLEACFDAWSTYQTMRSAVGG